MKYLNATIKNNIKPIPKSKKGLIKEQIKSKIIIKPSMFKEIDIKRIIVKQRSLNFEIFNNLGNKKYWC